MNIQRNEAVLRSLGLAGATPSVPRPKAIRKRPPPENTAASTRHSQRLRVQPRPDYGKQHQACPVRPCTTIPYELSVIDEDIVRCRGRMLGTIWHALAMHSPHGRASA